MIPVSTPNGHRSNTADFVDVLEGQTKGLVGGTCRGNNGVEGFQKGGSLGISFLAGDFPALVPGHVGGGFQHVVSVPSRDGDEGNGSGIVADLLDEALDFLDDFVEPGARVGGLGGVHLVDTNDQLLDAQSVSQKGVFTGLTVLGDTGLEFTNTGGDDQYTAIGLRGSSDHVLDEIPVAGGINDGDVVLGGFELLDGTFVDSTALVDQVTGGGRLTRVDVADDHDVNMDFFLRHGGCLANNGKFRVCSQ